MIALHFPLCLLLALLSGLVPFAAGAAPELPPASSPQHPSAPQASIGEIPGEELPLTDLEEAASPPGEELPGEELQGTDQEDFVGPPSPAVLPEDFPAPEGLLPAIAFWKRCYLEVTTKAGLLHDASHLGVVYEVVRIDGLGRRAQRRHIKARKQHWKHALSQLRRGAAPRDADEEHVVRLMTLALGREPTSRDYAQAMRRIRFQLGQRDKFRAGLIRSGAWEDEMRAHFRRNGLPEDLAFLPHVESSFNVNAYSKYGAAGVWQFMRSTGRRFMKIDYVVDERLDPMAATEAAARLLRSNYEVLGSWPLAVTAYNHGTAGMQRAKRRLHTDRIDVIVDKYKSRTFGFASRNFYAQFMAVREIMRSYESYFGPIARDTPEPVDEVVLPFYADIGDLRTYLGVSPEVVKAYNPSLRPPVFRSAKRIPRGFVLRLPAGTATPDVERWIAAIPPDRRHAKQHRLQYYQVRRGDTLSGIAKRNGTTVSALVAFNNLPSRHRIYPGQVLELPGSKPRSAPPFTLVREANAAVPEPAPEPKAVAKAEPAPEIAGPPRPTGLSAEGRPPVIDRGSPWRRVDGDRIMVDADETLGHFAEWLEVPTQRLRDLNDLGYRESLEIGQRIELDFSRIDPATFLMRRMEYHKGVEEDFFGTFRITGTVDHRLRRGESLWMLSKKRYRVPIWLIHRYNPDTDLTRLVPGSQLRIPVVERL